MARTYAFGKQWPEAVEWLRRAIAFKSGLDPSRDSVFSEIQNTREFTFLMQSVRDSTTPISHSHAVFSVPEGDLKPESMAYDRHANRFYFGSMTKGKVLRCSWSGACTQFASNLGEVLGVKISRDELWLVSNKENESALIHFDLVSGRLIRQYTVGGAGHEFNDLVIAANRDIYLTDTRAGALWHVATGGAALQRLPQRFTFANGIALSDDQKRLYVSTFPDGITIVDLKTGGASPIAAPADLCLASIDGLYFYRGALIAIQNGIMSPRVIRLKLSPDLRSISRYEILERRNPLFDGVTTGVISDGRLYFMANIQDDKKANFNPINILQISL